MTATTHREHWVAMGETEDVTECGCCGRVDLKRTIRMGIRNTETNEVEEAGFYGVVCAANHSGLTVRRIKSDVREARKAEMERRFAESAKRTDDFISWCRGQNGHESHSVNLHALGGFVAAMKAYKAAGGTW